MQKHFLLIILFCSSVTGSILCMEAGTGPMVAGTAIANLQPFERMEIAEAAIKEYPDRFMEESMHNFAQWSADKNNNLFAIQTARAISAVEAINGNPANFCQQNLLLIYKMLNKENTGTNVRTLRENIISEYQKSNHDCVNAAENHSNVAVKEVIKQPQPNIFQRNYKKLAVGFGAFCGAAGIYARPYVETFTKKAIAGSSSLLRQGFWGASQFIKDKTGY